MKSFHPEDSIYFLRFFYSKLFFLIFFLSLNCSADLLSALKKISKSVATKNYKSINIEETNSEVKKEILNISSKTKVTEIADFINYFKNEIEYSVNSNKEPDLKLRSLFYSAIEKSKIKFLPSQNPLITRTKFKFKNNLNIIFEEKLWEFYLEIPNFITDKNEIAEVKEQYLSALTQQAKFQTAYKKINSWVTTTSNLNHRIKFLLSKGRIAWAIEDLENLKSVLNFLKLLAIDKSFSDDLTLLSSRIQILSGDFSGALSTANTYIEKTKTPENEMLLQFSIIKLMSLQGLKKFDAESEKMVNSFKGLATSDQMKKQLLIFYASWIASERSNPKKILPLCKSTISINAPNYIFMNLHFLALCISQVSDPEINSVYYKRYLANKSLYTSISVDSNYIKFLQAFIEASTKKEEANISAARTSLKSLFKTRFP